MVGIDAVGRFNKNDYVLGTTSFNYYIPVYAVNIPISGYNDKIIMIPVIDDISIYNKPENKAKLGVNHISNYSDLFRVLENVIQTRVYSFTSNDVIYKLNCLKGYISDENDNVLLMLCTNKNESYFDDQRNIISEKLTLFISHELLLNDIYKNLTRKLDKDYISYFHEKDVDVVFTTSKKIEEHVYKNEFNVEYSSLTELHEHLRNDVAENYTFNSNDFETVEQINDIVEVSSSDDFIWQ